MLNFLLLMILPLLIAFSCLFLFKKKVTWQEFAGIIGIPAVFVLIGLCCAYWARTTDIEVWNGSVTNKQRNEVSCRHSYPCNCHEDCSGSGKDQSCTTVCDTCYEHSYDVDWDIYASTGESLSIDTVDRQGLVMPPRWGHAYIGEPYASSHSYTNYILANPESVLLGSKGDMEKYKALIPEYPSKIYDYYRQDPFINMGVPNVQPLLWTWLVRDMNAKIGPMKQVNVVVILVKTDNRDYMLALKDAWVGGKKNDVVVVIGSLDGHKIEFADVMSWTPASSFKVNLKNRIQDIGTLDERDMIVGGIKELTLKDFQRMHMKEYQYLMRSFQPSSAAMWWIFILSALSSIGFAIWSVLNEFTDDNPGGYSRYRYSRY
jgi:hypothetical protein